MPTSTFEPSNFRTFQLLEPGLIPKLDRLSLVLGRDLVSGLMGEHQAVRRTSGIEFADYRQYTPSDDLRRVDWNAYARLGTLHVRQAQAEHDTVLHLLVDASPSMDFGQPSKFLSARRLGAALGYVALAHLDSVVLTTPGAQGQSSRPKPQGPSGQLETLNYEHPTDLQFRSRAESGALFRALEELQVGQVALFDSVLTGWTAGSGGGSGRVAVVISDLLLDGYRDGIRRLMSEGFRVVVLHLLSPEELRPGEAGDFELIDSETGQRLDIRLGSESLTDYSRRLHVWLDETQAWCRANGARYLLVQSDWDIERVLLDTLRRRQVTA